MSFFYNNNNKNNSKHKLLFSVIFFVLIMAVIFLILPSAQKNTDGFQDETTSPPPTDSEPTASPTTEPTPTVDPYKGPDVPAQEAVGSDFFSDAAFMGNSLVDGFKLFSGLDSCDYYVATSMTVVGATSKACITLDNGNSGTLVDGLTQKPYGKIYILLGINEIGYDVDTFGELYSSMLDTIIAKQPDCDIYVMGLTPVSYAKSSSSDTFNMDRIKQYNEKLRSLASDKKCYYIDLVSALSGEDGYLPSSETTDGVHFSTPTYEKWLNYLKTHYIT